MCSACQGDYENPEPDAELEPEDVVLDAQAVADDAARRVARASWANTKLLMKAMGCE